MNYPRIYSLSTVGLIKHYNQDYLFHPVRTDFIGANGVGKSIIADLLQLLFIYDKEYIQFGTDGINPGERSIYSLPYKTNTGYCFLNVEVDKNEFVTMGVALSAQKGIRIIPFVLTRSVDIDSPIQTLTINKKNIPIAQDFIKSNVIPDINSLARELLDKKGLYLSLYRTREDVKRYYQFLYDKQILSINLSIETNLDAFSKVIQSFSKARALNLSSQSSSKSLKEFLFEDPDNEIVQDYNSQQSTLQRILKEYNRLNEEIASLSLKQENLTALRDLKQASDKRFKTFKSHELTSVYHELVFCQLAENETQQLLSQNKTSSSSLQKKLRKLEWIESTVYQALEYARSVQKSHGEYKILRGNTDVLENDIVSLVILSRPTLAQGWTENIHPMDMSQRSPNQIKELTKFAEPYLRKYLSLNDLKSFRENQRNDMLVLHQQLKIRKQNNERLVKMFEGMEGDTLMQWVLATHPTLTNQQEGVLLHFAMIPTAKSIDPKSGDKYLYPEQLFEETNMEPTENGDGFWIKLGPIFEFIESNPLTGSLKSAIDPEKSAKELIQRLKGLIDQDEKKLDELQNALDGKPYDRILIDQDYDLSIVPPETLDKLLEAIGCIAFLDEKIKILTKEKKAIEVRINEIKLKIPANIWDEDPSVLEKRLDQLVSQQTIRDKKLATYKATINGDLKQVQQNITDLSAKLIQVTNNTLEKQKDFSIKNQQYFNLFLENLSEFPPISEKQSLKQLEEEANDARHVYLRKYQAIIDRFDETKNGGNIGVNLEINTSSYAFRPLEEALLGTKLKATDNIADALRDANQSRLSMADDLKSSMIKVFETTTRRYKKFKEVVQKMNAFFKGRKISNQFYFKIEFMENKTLKIEFIEEMGSNMRNAAQKGELPFDRPVSEFIEEFFRKSARLTDRLPIEKLLSPKTYFDLSVSLTDEDDREISGSTGETYSAIALLGIARLSITQTTNRRGLRFIILEELGSLDNTNFNTFPGIAKDFDYQIVTMAPRPYVTGLSDEWYAHHLLKGKEDTQINLCPSASYFQTKDYSEDLQNYLTLMNNELDRTKSA